MYHSIVFKNLSGTITKNTWDDWRLIPSAKPSFPMPTPQTKYVEIPGRSGAYDITNYLTDTIAYNDRQGSFQFYAVDTVDDWDVRCDEIAKFLHGQELRAYLEDDPMYYYEGRFTFSEKKTDGKFPSITISYRVKPYKVHIKTGATAF